MTIFSLDIETYTAWDNTPEPVRTAVAKRQPHWDKNPPESRAALSPYTGQIICATLGHRDTFGSAPTYRTFYVSEEPLTRYDPTATRCASEVYVVQALVDRIVTLSTKRKSRSLPTDTLGYTTPDVMVTFYGHRFDLPFIVQRARLLGIGELYSRFMSLPLVYCDLADELTLHGHLEPRLSLDAYCALYGIPSPKAATSLTSGKDVDQAWREGKVTEVIAYNQADTQTLDVVYDLVVKQFGLRFTADQCQTLTHLFRTRVKAKYPG